MSGPPKPPGGFVSRPSGMPPLPPGFKMPPGVAAPQPPGMTAPPGGHPLPWNGSANPPQGHPHPPPQGYPHPPQGYSQPPQGKPLPPQGYPQPPQNKPQPPQGYSQPPQGKPLPPQGYPQPPQGYPQPPQGYPQPPQGKSQPPQGYPQPPQGYPQPPQGKSQPPQGYPQPPQGYPQPPQGYPQPPQGKSQPPQGYPQPPQGYPQPPQNKPQPPQGYPQPPQGYPHPPQGHPQQQVYPQPPGERHYASGTNAMRPSADTYPSGAPAYTPYPGTGAYGAFQGNNPDDQRGERYMRAGRREEDLREPTNTVWIGNLDPQEHSEEILRREFREFGKVMRIARVPDKSYCFVHFRRVEEAYQAVETLSTRGTLGRARFNYGKMFEYTQEEMDAPYDPNFRPHRRVREEDNTDDRRRRPRREEERIEEPTNVLWIGGLPPSVTTEELQENFKVFGTITNISRLEGRSMAFIHFETIESCSQALDLMRDQTIGGARVSLNYGRAQRSAPPPEELTSDGFPRNETPTNVVYLGQFSADVTEQDVEDLFEPYEGFINSKLIQSGCIAFGHFDTVEHACAARVALSNALLHGTPMRISFGKSNHTLTLADRMRKGRPAPLGGNGASAGAAGGEDQTGAAGSLDGFNGALVAGPGAPNADAHGTSALATLPGMGAMAGTLTAPQGPTFFTRERPVPDMTLDARLQSLMGTTYNSSGEAEKALSPGVIQTICDFIDGCVDEDTTKQLDGTIFLYTPLSSTHVFGILAKRMHEFYNDDPYKKLLILYAATRVLLGAKTDYIHFTKQSLNAFLMTLFVASEGQTPSGMEVFTSILENLCQHPFIERQNLDQDFIDVFRDQLDEILKRAKVDQDLASLIKKKRKR